MAHLLKAFLMHLPSGYVRRKGPRQKELSAFIWPQASIYKYVSVTVINDHNLIKICVLNNICK